MFREQSLTGLGTEARNMVLTFTWLFYNAITVTLSSWEGNQQAFSPASSPSSVTIYNLPLFPLKVNVISLSPSSPLNLYHTESSVCAFWQASYCRHIAADHPASAASLPFPAAVHAASSFFPKPSLSSALWLACALFSCTI